jgi:hypothetical protein
MLLGKITAAGSGYTVRKTAKEIGTYMVSLHRVISFIKED